MEGSVKSSVVEVVLGVEGGLEGAGGFEARASPSFGIGWVGEP